MNKPGFNSGYISFGSTFQRSMMQDKPDLHLVGLKAK